MCIHRSRLETIFLKRRKRTNNMSQDQGACVPTKWYHHYRFPLLPVIHRRTADKHNTSVFSFSWLFFRASTIDSFEFNFQISLQESFVIRAMAPYLIFGVFIPILPESFLYRFWRKPKRVLESLSE